MTDAPFFNAVAEGPQDGRAVWLTAADGVKIRAGLWNPQALVNADAAEVEALLAGLPAAFARALFAPEPALPEPLTALIVAGGLAAAGEGDVQQARRVDVLAQDLFEALDAHSAERRADTRIFGPCRVPYGQGDPDCLW